jgi:hypothetical protein
VSKKGFYKIKYDDEKLENETLERARLELLSKPQFFSNLETGEAAWKIEDIPANTLKSSSLVLNGSEWFALNSKSSTRRYFGNYYTEMYSPFADQVFYVKSDVFESEKAALCIQTFYRAKFRRSYPYHSWTSTAFTFETPASVLNEMNAMFGWAYLRRRSNNIGEVLAEDGVEWEEYTDKATFE